MNNMYKAVVQELRNDNSKFRELYYDCFMPMNMLAIFNIDEAVDALTETPLYRHSVKAAVGQLSKMLRIYKYRLREDRGKKYALYSDYVNKFYEMNEEDVMKYRNSVLLLIGRLGEREYVQEKSSMLVSCHLAEYAAKMHGIYMNSLHLANFGRREADVLSKVSIIPISRQLQKLCRLLLPWPDDKIETYDTSDIHVAGISAITSRLVTEGDFNYMMFAHLALDALKLDRENYSAEADIAEQEMNRLDGEMKRLAEKKAEDVKTAEKDSIAERLSGKFKVRRV